ncbi:FKBP-type peptidyl-prolyl cis-trans isomerase [Prevotella sp. E13-27]|uniref:FKBP-type peptidyl-prolyl cis-trans isomerase n=1 Tax=Prevotella sp. E13-27 TaxID=2938122 RepID=UPI00200A2C5F|nr:FKBP-type peptidyl-prolyl cis-trans isomerase [Prevotella sp. E13-27]MCK8621338.1 FKBP-type peptidyl-prolyl cis-trans isomerase [Prevotella sp. E13-27]
MKKILLLALTILVGASFTTAEAGKKDKKKKKDAAPVEAPVKLVSGSDSLSYMAGVTMTNGLMDYLIKQQGVDTAYIADFVAGFKEAITSANDPRQTARMAGVDIARQVSQRMFPGLKQEFTDTPDSIITDLFYRGFIDGVKGDTTVMKMTVASEKFSLKQQQNKAAKDEKLYGAVREAGRKFLEENKTKDGVITTPSGLQYKVLTAGTGVVPQRTDRVKVHYEGRLIDGTVFDASKKHGTEPAVFRADQVIKGWTEALTMMPVGSKWQLYIPYDLAYGERGAGKDIKPYATLIFDVELVGIEK